MDDTDGDGGGTRQTGADRDGPEDADAGGVEGADPGSGVGSGDDDTVEAPPGRPCPHCGASMFRRHCKYVCPEHGVVFDCADTFY